MIYLQIGSTPEGNFETMAHSWDILSINQNDKRTALSADRAHRLPSCKTQLILSDAVTGLYRLVTKVNTRVTQSRAVQQNQVLIAGTLKRTNCIEVSEERQVTLFRWSVSRFFSKNTYSNFITIVY